MLLFPLLWSFEIACYCVLGFWVLVLFVLEVGLVVSKLLLVFGLPLVICLLCVLFAAWWLVVLLGSCCLLVCLCSVCVNLLFVIYC